MVARRRVRVVLSIYSVSGCGSTSRLALSPHSGEREAAPPGAAAGAPAPPARVQRARAPRARRAHSHTCISHIHKHVKPHTRIHEELTRACDKRTHERDAVPASLLCCSAHCHSAQGARTAWQAMAAHGGCGPRPAARSAWRVHGACHRAMARGARHTARGTWVGGSCMARSRRVSSSLSSGLGLG